MSKRDQTAAVRIKMHQSRIKMYQRRLEKQAEKIKGMRRGYAEKYRKMSRSLRERCSLRLDASLKMHKSYNKAWKLKFIHKHHAKLEQKDHEIWKRGELIEELNIHLTLWKDVVPSEYFNACRNTLDKYIEDNTITKGTMNRKYTRKRRSKKKE